MAYRWTVAVTIPTEAVGASLSAAQDFGGYARFMGLIVPVDWSAAHISFKASNAIDGTFYDVYNEAGTEVKITTASAANRLRSLNALVPYISQFRYVKVRSGVTGAHTDQASAKTLTFLFQR